MVPPAPTLPSCSGVGRGNDVANKIDKVGINQPKRRSGPMGPYPGGHHWELKLRHTTSTSVKSLTKPLARTASVTSASLTAILGSVVRSGARSVMAAGLAMAVTTPALATCFIAGVPRSDIPDNRCLEAQRTGCVRSMLTVDQYRACLIANQNKRPSCVLNGVVRDDLSREDCLEARRTGCVQDRLTPAQYKSCLDAQPVRR